MNIQTTYNDVRTILYLTTIVNYHLWKHRNECVHENALFDYELLIKKLMRSVGARKRLQLRPDFSVHKNKTINRIEDLFNAILTLFNISFPIDNG